MNRVRAGLILGVFVAAFTVPVQTTGGQTPLDAAAQMAGGGMNGDWKNVDANGGIMRVVIQGAQVHPYGRCTPTYCDWGVLRAQSFASKVDEHDTKALMATKDTNFNRTVLIVTQENDSRLRVETFEHFTDNSHRADYSTIDYFSRQ